MDAVPGARRNFRTARAWKGAVIIMHLEGLERQVLTVKWL